MDGDVHHFEMRTMWADFEAISRFAGPNPDVAYYYDFDDDFLIEKEPRVRHFEAHRG